jgi:hypothetical protein
VYVRALVFLFPILILACGEGRDRGRGSYTPGARCGNDNIENGEVCEDGQLGSATCESLGLTTGTLGCAADCKSLDRSACGAALTCGNSMIEGAEICDGTMLQKDCAGLGFGGGTLNCLPNCNGYDTRACTTPQAMCNDGRVEGVEVCDGTNLGGVTCQSLGFASGTLSCAADCASRITSGCTGGSCTPDCNNRVCGLDPVCGQSCGTCSSGSCNVAGQCEGTSTSAPRILSFTSNVTRLTENQGVVFSAIVTDPDGVGDVIGGQLRSPSGGTYGTFATAAEEGAYSLSIGWSSIHQLEAINAGPGGTSRVFRAEFFDVAGHTVQQDITISLGCTEGTSSICDGQCQATESDRFNCGSCGHICGPSFLPWNEGQGVCFESSCWGIYSFDAAIGLPSSCATLCGTFSMTCGTRPEAEFPKEWCQVENASDIGCARYYDSEMFVELNVSLATCNSSIPASMTFGAANGELTAGMCFCRD